MKKVLLSLSIFLIAIFISGTKPVLSQIQTGNDIFNDQEMMLLAQIPMEDDLIGGSEGGLGGNENKGRLGQKGMQGGGQLFSKLNLTEDQKSKLKAQRESSVQQVKTLREQLKTERSKLMSTLFDPNSTKTEMLSQQAKVNALQNQMAKVRIENIAYLKGILTAEQKKTLSQIASERRQMIQNKMNQRRNSPKNVKN